jgi:hypothetical protein
LIQEQIHVVRPEDAADAAADRHVADARWIETKLLGVARTGGEAEVGTEHREYAERGDRAELRRADIREHAPTEPGPAAGEFRVQGAMALDREIDRHLPEVGPWHRSP